MRSQIICWSGNTRFLLLGSAGRWPANSGGSPELIVFGEPPSTTGEQPVLPRTQSSREREIRIDFLRYLRDKPILQSQ